MITEFNVGDEVLVRAEIEEIHVNKEGKVFYIVSRPIDKINKADQKEELVCIDKDATFIRFAVEEDYAYSTEGGIA